MSKSSRKPRKMYVNLSESDKLERAYEAARTRRDSSDSSNPRDCEHPRLEHPRLERAGAAVTGGAVRLRALAVDARRGVARRGSFCMRRAGRSTANRRGGGSWGGAAWRAWQRGWGGGGAGARWGGGRRTVSRLAVDGGRGVGGRVKPRPTRGRVNGGGAVCVRAAWRVKTPKLETTPRV
jgi:hypothetical protein